jgi:2-C-methyl-D-erythritol 4-phosphate cytidylyltransferase/2-C-methyl-D-erythritol 2,4-cyclodiphosphate synthase
MQVTAIIAAGGRGRRLGAGVPKQLLDLGGRPMLQWSLDTFLACGRVGDLVVVVPPEWIEAPPACLQHGRIRLVAGGERRQDSVANGFAAVPAETDIVLIHDAARPLVDAATIDAAIDAAAEAGAAIVAIPARDTIKWSAAGVAAAADGFAPDAGRVVERTLPRERVFLAQTPQAFRRDVLGAAVALGQSGVEGTDEAALAERAGYSVRLVEGSVRNIKITTVDDLVMAEALVKAISSGDDVPRQGSSGRFPFRIGSGYDLHRFAHGRRLVLGGVEIPFDRGLQGHSDADALCHAVIDAVLGAASLGDIGHHFPDDDERWHGASSIGMLEHAVSLVGRRGFRIVNVDATIVTERPKLGPHREAVIASLARALGTPVSAVSVKAKTNEGVDAIGRGEALAVHAVALLQRDGVTDVK